MTYTQTSIPLARPTDPETSHEAAASVETIRESQMRVWLMLHELGGATDEELIATARRIGWLVSDSGLRTRRSELVKMEMVVDSGERKRTKAGRRTIVWQVAG